MKTNRLQILLVGLLLLGSGGFLSAQGTSIIKIDTIEMNRATQTVDIYLHAIDADGEPFVDFGRNGHELVLTEVLLPGQKVDTLDRVSFWAIKDSTRFGDRTIIQVLTQSAENTHKERRLYRASWMENGKEIAFFETEVAWPARGINLRETYSFLDLFVLGLTLAAIVLLILSELIPWWKTYRFRKEHVKPYGLVKDEGVQDNHPISGRPIQKEDLVVRYCDRTYCRVPLEVWKKRGYQCMHYPLQCEGNPRLGNRQFFKQIDFFRQLNWLWFGLLGGVVAWSAVYLLEKAFSEASDMWQNVALGVGLGFGLTLMLSWVEDRGQSRELSLLRIVLRTVVGALASGLIFLFGYFLEKWIGFNWVAQPLIWLLFSTALGAVLSVSSSIILKRGLISGLIAGSISAILYGVFLVLVDDTQLARLLAFSILGAIMGYGIIQVVKRLQEIRMEVLSPSERSGISIDLDKWLQAGEKVVIGNHMENKIRVKWVDEFAKVRHAEMRMENQEVRIQPLADAELWINGEPVKAGKTYILKGGEHIQLARNSRTVFRYMQKAQLS